MQSLTIDVDASAALQALASLQGPALASAASAALREAALFGERTVVGLTPARTGALRASIQARPLGQLGWKIASPLPYAAVVEAGSRAHTIVPRRARVLRFQPRGGGVVYARRVQHPGTRGRQMFARAAAQLQARLPEIVARTLAGTISGALGKGGAR